MKVIRQGVPALLLSLAILSGSVCLASGAEVQTVRATLWDAWPITVDETPICTVNEYDRFLQRLRLYPAPNGQRLAGSPVRLG